jgi:hypothetical protein
MSDTLDNSAIVFGKITEIRPAGKGVVVVGKTRSRLQTVDESLKFNFSNRRRVAIIPTEVESKTRDGKTTVKTKIGLHWCCGNSDLTAIKVGTKIAFERISDDEGGSTVGFWTLRDEYISMFGYATSASTYVITVDDEDVYVGTYNRHLQRRIDIQGRPPLPLEFQRHPHRYTISRFSGLSRQPQRPESNLRVVTFLTQAKVM